MKRLATSLVILTFAAVVAIIAMRLVFPLPDITDRPESHALPTDTATGFGKVLHRHISAHPGLTGVHALTDGHEALGRRLFLASRAETSIDAQYYIWHDDVSGLMLLNALHDAAARGVRVRLLLDDNGVPGMDDMLAALNAQPNFEIRLFNPSTVRNPKLLGYAYDFFRMNRRMHNKAFVVDGAVAIVGGRNIGDAYFQLGDDNVYIDADVMGLGAIAPETQAAFDAYWNSQSVFALESIVEGSGDLDDFLTRAAAAEATEVAVDFRAAMIAARSALTRDEIDVEWTNVEVFVDDPLKGLGQATDDQMVISQISPVFEAASKRVDLVSAYFVPGANGAAALSGLAQSGRAVTIQTNALNTTDVLMVHAGYSKYRRELLEAGVVLLELKPYAGGAVGDVSVLPFGSLGVSGASLHAKAFAVDEARIFVGSFNFDPRSARLNCEMGFLIDSPTLAAQLRGQFEGELAETSYRVSLTPENRMIWQETLADGQVVTHQREPGSTLFQRLAIIGIGLLPVEWLL